MVICLVFVGANIIKFGAASAANVGPQYAAEGVVFGVRTRGNETRVVYQESMLLGWTKLMA